MYDTVDWGSPAPPEWSRPGERIDLNLPATLIRVLRSRARAEGVSVSVLVQRLVSGALNLSR